MKPKSAESSLWPDIKGPLLIQLAGDDARVNAAYPEYEAALAAAGVAHQVHRYDGAKHGFHNDSTSRYDEAAAELAWSRTVEFFSRELA